MTVVNPKSISGINSITMASGGDDLLTIHSNNTTERVRVNNSGDVIVGSGVTLSPDGDIFATGIVTATTFNGAFSGDGSALTGVANTDVIFTDKLGLGDGTATTGDQINIGVGSDFKLYHNGSHSFIDNNTGDLNVESANVYIKANNTENAVDCVANGAVTLYHNNSAKLATSSSGVTVTGTVAATSYTGDGSALTGVNAISVAQQFRLAADQAGSGSAGTVLTNWEEADTDYQRIGSSIWSVSSGVFSCSVTGIYLCMWTLVCNDTSTGDAFDPNIQISTDSGSNWDIRSRSWGHIQSGSTARDSPANQFIVDVSNTSTFRLRYRQSAANDLATGTTIAGSTSENLTNIMFIRLGDT